ncbi:MAG: CesT family type III secretion system chaperone [Chlamydiia bacterium]|nr:CesT family type III secretion system chaperone [Chlamydiia bacterium]
MTDRFEELLQELGRIFQLPLHVDKIGACSIMIPPHPAIQLQLDETQEHLLLFSKIVEIVPGKFRENVLCDALKANALTDPRPGILGYIGKSNELALYQKYRASFLNGERLASYIGLFLEMALAWKVAIEHGNTAP